MLLLLLAASFVILEPIAAQKSSACPSILVYEPPGAEQDRYYAWISVTNSPPLSGIWLRIILDEPTDMIGNWFGAADKKDDRSFLIKNREYQFDPSKGPLSIRFFVKYDPNGVVPSIVGIRLNGKVLCPMGEPEATTQEPQLFLSHKQGELSDSQPAPTSAQSTPAPPALPPRVSGNSDDDDFPSDFSPSRRRISVLLSSVGVKGNSCGTVKVPARPLITYGQNTVQGEWPWHAALYRNNNVNLKYICGGSLISPTHVLTAAHCVNKLQTEIPVSAELFTVYLGKYSLYGLSPAVQGRSVSKITTHPEYNATYFRNDIAVMHLETAAEITDFVRPVCIWQEDVNLNNIIEKLGTVVGWGVNEKGELSETLMQAKMPVVSTQDCIFSYREFFSLFASDRTFCAGFRNGTSLCTGDSGGGMVFPRSDSSGQNVVWQIRGIVSLSAALQNDKVACDTSNYVLFTDVAKYIGWLNEVMKS